MDLKTENSQTQEIFERQRSEKRRKKRRRAILTVLAAVAAVAALLVGIRLLQNRVRSQIGVSSSDEVLTAEVITGSVRSTVSGSGTLSSEELDAVEIYSGLEIDEFFVEEGQQIEEGDLLATVTRASLLTAMSQLQAQLDAIDQELAEADIDDAAETVAAGVSGRVKAIFAQSGDDVAVIMNAYGALAWLSLDGTMALDAELGDAQVGNAVSVVLSDGTSLDGTVVRVINGTATVCISDAYGQPGETVVVLRDNAADPVESELYIHSRLSVTGYMGTVSAVSVSLNDSVSVGDTLMTLTDTTSSAVYDSLLKKRATIEEALLSVISVYQSGGVYADRSGTVETLVSSGGTESGMGQNNSVAYKKILYISGDETMIVTFPVDESEILTLKIGQAAEVTIDSIGTDSYPGSVSAISTEAVSSGGVTVYSVDVSIDRTGSMLAGMSASAAITIEGVEGALLIPTDALQRTSSTAYVYTAYDQEKEELTGVTEVSTGLSGEGFTEITSGLREGDVVYYTEKEEQTHSGGMMSGIMGGGSHSGSGSHSRPDSN